MGNRGVLGDRARAIEPFWPAVVVVALQLVAFPMAGGRWALGALTGLLTALVALGLALVYRANRILNFAQGDLGTAPTGLAVGLIAVSGLPYAAGFGIGLVAAVVLGVLVERTVVRRLARSSRLLLTVATIGVSQLLVAGGLLLPRLWGRDTLSDRRIPEPFDVELNIGSQIFGGDEVLALAVAPLLLLALVLFLRGTDAGVAVRAAAEGPERAALLGVPARRLQTLVWAAAAALSFVGVFLHAGIFGFAGASSLAPQALVFALGALVLGRLEHLPAVAASAVALRVLGAGVEANNPSQPGRVYVVIAAVILAVLVARRPRRSRRGEVVTWSTAGSVRPIPHALARLRSVRLARVVLPAAAVAVAAALPLVLGPGDELRASTVGAFCLVTLSIVVLTGWAGQVSLGQMSFVAVGAAVGAVATHTWEVDLTLALVVAGAAGAAAAVVVGLPALRAPGLLLAVTTLAFSLASSNWLLNRREQSWIPRDRIERPMLLNTFDLTSQAAMYEVVLVVVVLGFLAVAAIRRSPTGRTLLATRDNDRAAASYGIPVVRAKLAGFALSGFLAAVAGCLLVHVNQGYTERPFTAAESLAAFTAAVVGGVGTLAGAVLGAVYLNGGTWLLPERLQLLPTAVGVLAVLLVLPGGLDQLLYGIRSRALAVLARRRGVPLGPVTEPALGAAAAADGDAAGAAGTTVEAPPAAVARGANGDGDRAGAPMLSVRGLEVAYGDVQIVFGVDLDVRPGEIVALLGTNGAGKSTILRAVCGIAPAKGGTVAFDGRDITRTQPEEIARLGIAQVPGGNGVFPSLTVAENLRTAGWLLRRDAATRTARVEEVLDLFPVLRERRHVHASELSGGQQQMLALAMTLLGRPRLLLVDELSLGLAPAVVEELLGVLRRLRDAGTTILVVEQSVNLALTVADRAYFLEKGQVRYHGPTAALLDRPDILRSVFLAGRGGSVAARDRRPDTVAGTPTGAGTPAVAAREVSVRFGGIQAVDQVDLAVAPGEVVGLIGPNGAGKTTLIDLLSGFCRPASGRVELHGVDVTGAGAHRRALLGLGRSFQDSRLFPSLTVEEALLVAVHRWLDVRDPFNAALRLPPLVTSEAAARHRVDELVELLGLGDFRSTFVGQLSTGTRRIVDLGCVLAHGPSVVLLDEPSSGIAQREAEELGPLLLQVRDELGASLVVVEHDMALISSIADRLVALDQGAVVTAGPPAEVLAHPEVVASYLGTDAAAIGRSGTASPAAAGNGAGTRPPARSER